MQPSESTDDPSAVSVLVCAGVDSSGRAGLDADREAVGAAGGSALPVATTRTVQEGMAVLAIEPRAVETWEAEASDLLRSGPGAIKFGLLSDAAAVGGAARIASAARSLGLPVVVDPVLSASSGERFLDPAGTRALVEALPALGVVLTPNLGELAELAGTPELEHGTDLEARIAAAYGLVERGARAVAVKGGHGGEDPVVDLLVSAAGVHRAERPRHPGPGIRGSGCRFASYLATRWALLGRLEQAFEEAGEWVAARIAGSR